MPVINGLSDEHHPCQALADVLTLRERFGYLEGLRLAYVGDGNNVANSLCRGRRLTGVDVVVAAPRGFGPTAPGANVVEGPHEAVSGAHAVYTDVWVSMGDETQREQRLHELAPYRVDAELMSFARPDAVFLHCLPAHRGEEVTDEVIDGRQSAVWQQAANRLPTEQALLYGLISRAPGLVLDADRCGTGTTPGLLGEATSPSPSRHRVDVVMSEPVFTVSGLDALPPPEVARKAEDVGIAKAAMHPLEVFVLAVLAGAFIALGAAFATTVMAGGSELPLGVVRLLGGLAFTLGLILVVVAGAELFTGNNLVVMAWASRRVSTSRLLGNWALVYAGNFVGALGTVALVYLGRQYELGGGEVGRPRSGSRPRRPSSTSGRRWRSARSATHWSASPSG